MANWRMEMQIAHLAGKAPVKPESAQRKHSRPDMKCLVYVAAPDQSGFEPLPRLLL